MAPTLFPPTTMMSNPDTNESLSVIHNDATTPSDMAAGFKIVHVRQDRLSVRTLNVTPFTDPT